MTNFCLTDSDRSQLKTWLRSTTLTQGVGVRARILLALDKGQTPTEIARNQGVSRRIVYKWRSRFMEGGLDNLVDKPRSGRPTVIDRKTVRKVLHLTTERIPREATHWSIQLMAKYAGISTWQVRQIWKEADLKPHRVETLKISHDPAFANKVVDIVGLYMNPPTNAMVLSVDEKTPMQAPDRTQPGLPLAVGGEMGSRTHDDKRHGRTSLYAAFHVLTGEVIGRLTDRSRSREFLTFLKHIDRTTDRNLDLHIILDNPGAHKTTAVMKWVNNNPRGHFHFTPTSSSWLNAVEGWFAQLERRALYRGAFTSVKELKDEIRQFIKVHNQELAKPFRWTKSAEKMIASVERTKKVLLN